MEKQADFILILEKHLPPTNDFRSSKCGISPFGLAFCQRHTGRK
jgi:hypothetical protein